MIEINSLEELYTYLENNRILIYGAGYIGDNIFYSGLKKKGLDYNVVSFVTTTGSDQKVDGLEVRCIDDIDSSDDYLICIAVHDSILQDIVDNLEKRGFKKYLWITPFRFQILLGKPKAKGIDVSLKKIWSSERKRISIPTRLLVVEQFYGNNTCGYDIYRHHLNLFEKSEKTSQHRLKSFINLIQSVEQLGMDDTECIAITQNGDIIDGAHRVSLAIWFRYKYVRCDIYDASDDYRKIHCEASSPDIENADKLGFNNSEVREIERIRDIIDKQIETLNI